jgi:uncharacterized protein YgfB (UPF0149 family)
MTRTVEHDYKVGDEVSHGFNGDWYPDGVVTKITKQYLHTSTGHKYFKYTTRMNRVIRDDNGKVIDSEEVLQEVFKMVRGYSYLCHGHFFEQNPSF